MKVVFLWLMFEGIFLLLNPILSATCCSPVSSQPLTIHGHNPNLHTIVACLIHVYKRYKVSLQFCHILVEVAH